MNAIEVSNVTKRFNLVTAGAGSLKTAVIDAVRGGRRAREFVALDNVSLGVKRGETLGVIGANGSGKSTLLSIIARTMTPTSGTVETRGVVSSLLELGAGFHPDLTGRENVMLYGSIMGISREVMRSRFDAIVDFAGLGEFIDQPVRFYSSGMYVRLGFSVATQVDPDILLVDEVLAVGDHDFQRKCLAKMGEFRKAGKSMILISHDLNAICQVADRAVCLKKGKIIGEGDPGEMAGLYSLDSRGAGAADLAQRREWGTREAKITNAELVSSDANVLRFKICYSAPRRIDEPTFGFAIATEDGRTVCGSNTEIESFNPIRIEGDGSIQFTLDCSKLNTGIYLMSFSLHSRDHQTNYHRLDNCLSVRVNNPLGIDGIVKLPATFEQYQTI